jgi:hypothetical protein
MENLVICPYCSEIVGKYYTESLVTQAVQEALAKQKEELVEIIDGLQYDNYPPKGNYRIVVKDLKERLDLLKDSTKEKTDGNN